MQVSVPTLTGPGIRRLGLPKSFPGPSYTDLVIGERLSTGQCEFQRHIPLHPGLYIVFTEVDLAHCKAVVAQLDWHAKLDSLIVVRSPLVPTQKRALTR